MSVTEFPCCVLCLVKNEENSIFCKSDNNKKLFRKFLNFINCRLKVGELDFNKLSSSFEETSGSTPTLCERCSEVASNICDLHEELSSIETRMFLKLEELEGILSLETVTDSTVSNKRGMLDVERFRELLTRQVRCYFDVERWWTKSNDKGSSSKEDVIDSDSSGAKSEIKSEAEASPQEVTMNEPENEDYDDNESDTNFIVEDDSESESTKSLSSSDSRLDEFDEDEAEDDYEEVKPEFFFNEEEDPLKIEIQNDTEIEVEGHTEEEAQYQHQQPTVTNQSQGKRSRKSAVIPRQDFDDFSVSMVEVPPEPQKKRPKLSDPRMTETERDWSCGICKKSFVSPMDLTNHMRDHEDKVKETKIQKKPGFQCPFCTRAFYLEETLKVHKQTARHHHASRYFSDFRFRCDGENGENECCTETYETFADLGHHLETRHPGAVIHHCSTCKWPFLNESARDLHQLNHITSIKNKKGGKNNWFQCPITNCPKFCCHFSSFACHFSTAHGTGLRPYSCPQPECPYRGYSIPHINVHIAFVHKTKTLNDKPEEFFCDICSVKSFETLKKLKRHQEKCRGMGVCDICGEKLLNFRELANHKLQVHQVEPPRFVCDRCGKGLLSEARRNIHLRSHEKRDAKPKELLCPHCGKVFHHETNLKRHIAIIHVKETTGQERKRDYVCQDCGNAYFIEKDLNRHRIMTHLSEEEQRKRQDRFRCPLCQKGFLLLDYLKGHIRTVHKVDPNETLETSKWKQFNGVDLIKSNAKESKPKKTQRNRIN